MATDSTTSGFVTLNNGLKIRKFWIAACGACLNMCSIDWIWVRVAAACGTKPTTQLTMFIEHFERHQVKLELQ